MRGSNVEDKQGEDSLRRVAEVLRHGHPRARRDGVSILGEVAGDGELGRELAWELVAALVEVVLPEAEGGACERALAALDALCGSSAGASAAREHALTVPVVVKKMLRVSEAATELAVSVLWRICAGDPSSVAEAVQAGAFVKVLVVVQIGCAAQTRERASGLLKLFNRCASGQWERCADTLGLMHVRRSF